MFICIIMYIHICIYIYIYKYILDPKLCNNYQENALDSAVAGGYVQFAER
jgi:hypothetical protein